MPEALPANAIVNKCPKCGSAEVTLYDVHNSYPLGKTSIDSDPTCTQLAYGCVCGCAYTDMVNYLKQELSHA